MRWVVMLACLAGLATAQSAAAQSADREGRWETRLGFVFLNSSDADLEGGTTTEFDSDTGFRSGFGYQYTDNLEFGMNLGIGTTGYSADVAGDEPGEFFAVRSDLEYTTLTIDGFSYGVGVGARYDLTDTIAVHGSYRINWIDFDNADSTPDFDGKVAGG